MFQLIAVGISDWATLEEIYEIVERVGATGKQ